ncbi:sporulation protein [Clostridium sp. K25]|uniref:GerW family sporulation protein n=1 Tax=Clostridium TaxID=1485 RepID=UPI0004D92266|nr:MULTISPECIES: GerW family sporulation protein [Clostridium]KEI10558.1 sporulation protein [Clostridium sp. K25]MCD3244349.1 sporulation protein YtfJ [Clostridium botulinum C]MCD3260907.1 sporulation protein YtfJ [Clostridium botulinum C]
MESHPIESLMKNTLENLKDMIDVNTVVGDAIKTIDGTVIVPISKVAFGFASGGSEFYNKHSKEEVEKYPFGGGSGSGVSVKPIAFLVIKDDLVRLLPIEQSNISILDKLIDQIPKFADILKNSKKDEEE